MEFPIGRNPDAKSRLPYLLRRPIVGGLVLKARDMWPRTSRVFCARMDGGWPEDADILLRVRYREIPAAHRTLLEYCR